MKRVRNGILAVMTTGLGLLAAGVFLTPDPRLLYNPSASAERGWYRVYPGAEFGQGSLVAARLPARAWALAETRGYLPAGLPVIKTIGALSGDEICWREGEVVLPDGTHLELLKADSAGRPLPAPEPGCRTLKAGEAFLLSGRIAASYDSRYFGPVDASGIIGPVRFLGEGWCAAAASFFAATESSGRTGYCKIKARSAETGPEPCLHIDSSGAIARFAAPLFHPYAPYCRDFRQRYVSDDPHESRIRH